MLPATDSRKESRCLSCFPIQLSKNRPRERAARLPDPSVRVKRNVSVLAEAFASRANPFRLTRTPIPHWCCWIGKIELPEDCRDGEVYVLPFALSTIASGTFITCYRPPLFQPACPFLKDRGVSAGICANASRRLPIPGQPCTTCCACCGYGSLVRELLPALGPVTTAGRGVLFPDFGKMSAVAATSTSTSHPERENGR